MLRGPRAERDMLVSLLLVSPARMNSSFGERTMIADQGQRTRRLRRCCAPPRLVPVGVFLASAVVLAQGSSVPDWTALQDETMQHFQALLRFDTSDPPGNEKPAAEYLKQVLEREGIPSRSSRSSRTGPTSSRGSRATARSGRCSSWRTPTP